MIKLESRTLNRTRLGGDKKERVYEQYRHFVCIGLDFSKRHATGEG